MRIPAATSTNSLSKLIGGSGLKYTIYRNDNNIQNLESFRNAVRNELITPLILEEGVTSEPDDLKRRGEDYSIYMRGYFKAPITG
jgi:hypothetical protein